MNSLLICRGIALTLSIACYFSVSPAFAQSSPEIAALSEQEGSWLVVDTFKAGPDWRRKSARAWWPTVEWWAAFSKKRCTLQLR